MLGSGVQGWKMGKAHSNLYIYMICESYHICIGISNTE